MSENPFGRSQRSYPLNSLFVLMAACSIVTALLSPVAREVVNGSVGVPETIAASISCTIFATFIGGIVGMYHYRRIRGGLLGICVGGIVGSLMGPLALAPQKSVPTIMALFLFGSILLVGIGAAFRATGR